MTLPRSVRLTYRQLAREVNEPFLRALEQEPEVMRFLGLLRFPGENAGQSYIFMVFCDDSPIGLVGFVRSDASAPDEPPEKDVELICALVQKVRREHYGVECCAAILMWAWSTHPWRRVLASVEDDNKAAVALTRALGFRPLVPEHRRVAMFGTRALVYQLARPSDVDVVTPIN